MDVYQNLKQTLYTTTTFGYYQMGSACCTAGTSTGKNFHLYQGNVAKKTTQGRLYCFRKKRHVYRIPYDQAMLDCIAI